MKLSKYENEEALDVLAELIEPATRLLSNPELVATVKGGKSKLEIAKVAIQADKQAIIEILAICEGVPVEEYRCTPITIVKNVIELLSDKELVAFFKSQV